MRSAKSELFMTRVSVISLSDELLCTPWPLESQQRTKPGNRTYPGWPVCAPYQSLKRRQLACSMAPSFRFHRLINPK